MRTRNIVADSTAGSIIQADTMPPNKYPVAINVRGLGESSIRTRPGYVSSFNTGAQRATDMRAYTALGTDNLPRIIVHDSNGQIYLDNGANVGRVGLGGPGASMIPFRPNQSPQSWMYIANPTGYKKFSAPTIANAVTSQNVGIAEPQSPPEACPEGFLNLDFTGDAGYWAKAGTAGSPGDVNRNSGTLTAIYADPASVSPTLKTRYSAVLSGTTAYSIGQEIKFHDAGAGYVQAVVEDVFPAIATTTAITISKIFYFNNNSNTGRCFIVPSQITVSPDTPVYNGGDPNVAALANFLTSPLAGLKRGSLVTLGGTETVMVLSVSVGPNGSVCFEASTVNGHGAGETIVGVAAIAVSGISSAHVGHAYEDVVFSATMTAGIATWTYSIATHEPANPFGSKIGTLALPQVDDFVHISFQISDPSKLTDMRLLFDIGDGSFTQNYLYYAVEQSDLQSTISNAATQSDAVIAQFQTAILNFIAKGQTEQAQRVQMHMQSYIDNASQSATGASQWTEITFPISKLTRVGNDQKLTLANCVSAQVAVNCTGSVTVIWGDLYIGGCGQPNVGTQAMPYFYRVRPRSSVTGARGNPSPSTRYGVAPQRQRVIVSLPSASYDSQITNWDIFRMGGTITPSNPQVVGSPWRYIGTALATDTTFIDDQFDDSALAGDALDFDNFEPWPSVDAPYSATVGDGNTTAINIYGSIIEIVGTTFPSSMSKWLPGTFIVLNGQQTFTLRSRPYAIWGGYHIEINENAGSPTVTKLDVMEPNVAAQINPYVWGPSAEGVFFAVGDPLRPGVFQASKQNNPDSIPDNAYDLTPPSEPLLGGEIIDGLSVVASSERWWALQPAFGTAKRWNPVDMPAGRGLAAPWGKCTDGKAIYFWAKDGIYAMAALGGAISLTDADLANLFPHGRVLGRNCTYAGYTFYAPDYSRSVYFRLTIADSILKAHYVDSGGNQRTIVLDMSPDPSGNPRMAWSVDAYADSITNSYKPEQTEGSLITPGTSYAQKYLCDSVGKVYVETDNANDNGTAIVCALGTFEWDCGDVRVPKRWLDSMLDCVPVSGITATPISGGVAATTSSVAVASSVGRAQPPALIPPAAAIIKNYLGLLLVWTDDFSHQTSATHLIAWSMECVGQPVGIQSWTSVPTSHGLEGYHHIRKLILAYMSMAAVTLTITAYDGISPAVITLPSTGGAYQKVEFVPSFNKGMLFTYDLSSSKPFSMIMEDCEIEVGSWERASAYATFRDLGGRVA